VHGEVGTFAKGKARGDKGLQIAAALDHPPSIMWAHYGIGLLSLRQGDLPRALPLLEQAVGLCQDADLLFYFPLMTAALGAAYALGGRVADAVPLLTQALEQTTSTEAGWYQAPCRFSLGEAQARAGRLEKAQALAERALALTRERQERGNEAYALRLLGEVAAHRAPPAGEQAAAYYRQALTLADELGMRPLQAHCHLGLGTLYSRTRQQAQAQAELAAAIALYRAMEMTFLLPETVEFLRQGYQERSQHHSRERGRQRDDGEQDEQPCGGGLPWSHRVLLKA
jgi:tetratricopeptide (TPR) repeat protein